MRFSSDAQHVKDWPWSSSSGRHTGNSVPSSGPCVKGTATAFFHAHATAKMRRNNIKSIVVDGVQVTKHSSKVQALTQHFKSIIGVAGHSNWHFDCEGLYRQLPKATDDLTVPFTEVEAKQALKSMNRCSAPGPDGFGLLSDMADNWCRCHGLSAIFSG